MVHKVQADLPQYDAIVFLNTTGNVLDSKGQTAFEKYIQGGGSFMGVHAAADTEYDWPWYGNLALGRQYNAGEFLSVHEYTHVVAWAEKILERPAVQRGRMVNRTMGDASEQLWERHDASDFDTQTQDKIGDKT
jgi:hypothetical protein